MEIENEDMMSSEFKAWIAEYVGEPAQEATEKQTCVIQEQPNCVFKLFLKYYQNV